MTTKSQPSLFEGAEQAAASGATSRAEFLAGMLAVWLLGDRKPSKAQREEMMKLSRRLKHHRRPCNECPWSKETPPGQFPLSRYEELAHTSGEQGAEAPIGSPLFACHMTIEGRDAPCAGWLAAVGIDSLPVRILIAYDELPASVLEPGPDWPELFTSYAEMMNAQAQGYQG